MLEEGIGNTLIRYNDRWRGPCYLTDNLTFTPNKSKACRFYLLKPSDTLILNHDHISINCGNRTLTIDEHNKVNMTDRGLINREINTFIITNGLDNTEAIAYDAPVFLLSAISEDKALCYIHPGFQTPASLGNAVINSELINTFTFYLERADDSIINKVALSNPMNTKKNDDSYRNAIIIVLLLVILMLTMILNKN